MCLRESLNQVYQLLKNKPRDVITINLFIYLFYLGSFVSHLKSFSKAYIFYEVFIYKNASLFNFTIICTLPIFFLFVHKHLGAETYFISMIYSQSAGYIHKASYIIIITIICITDDR